MEGFRANRVAGNRIFPYRMPKGLRPGTRLYRNNDQEFERLLSKPSATRKIPIHLTLRAVGDGFELSSEGVSILMPTEQQQANRDPRENIVRQLTKLGDTIYTCEDVDIPDDFNYFIPNSVLSEMRRTLVNKLAMNHDGRLHDTVQQSQTSASSIQYPYPYLYNISNRLSRDFYGARDLTAFELKGGDGPIMQCRHCIRYALGYCVKHGGKRPQWREPLFLVLGDGRRFRLDFDCKNCEMRVFNE